MDHLYALHLLIIPWRRLNRQWLDHRMLLTFYDGSIRENAIAGGHLNQLVPTGVGDGGTHEPVFELVKSTTTVHFGLLVEVVRHGLVCVFCFAGWQLFEEFAGDLGFSF